MVNKRPPASDDRLHENRPHRYHLRPTRNFHRERWNLAVKDRAYSIPHTPETKSSKSHAPSTRATPLIADGKVYSGVIVAAYVDPKVAHRGFIRFHSHRPQQPQHSLRRRSAHRTLFKIMLKGSTSSLKQSPYWASVLIAKIKTHPPR